MDNSRTHLLIDGRRWRATDPSIPEALRAELVRELMSARRAVGAAAADDPAATQRARDRVQDAKVALGERGEPWWDAPTESGRRRRVTAALRALLRGRGHGTVCPSDIARVTGGDGWRSTMDVVRAVGAELADAGELEVRQGGDRVADPHHTRGPIRYATPPDRLPSHDR